MGLCVNRTVKHDWFSDLLASKHGMLVSGHRSFAERLGIKEEAYCSIKFVSFRHKFLWLLIVEADKCFWDSIAADLKISPMFTLLNQKFQNNLHINMFSTDKADGFMFDDRIVDIEGMCEIYESLLPKSTYDAGTQKEVNKTVADNLHEFHREYLSKYCVANDIDAIQFKSDGHLLYELKRVKEDVKSWMPYLDDYSNYDRLLKISNMLKFKPYAIAYNLEQQRKVAFHYDLQPTNQYIAGTAMIADLELGVMDMTYENKYLSTNRRR